MCVCCVCVCVCGGVCAVWCVCGVVCVVYDVCAYGGNIFFQRNVFAISLIVRKQFITKYA